MSFGGSFLLHGALLFLGSLRQHAAHKSVMDPKGLNNKIISVELFKSPSAPESARYIDIVRRNNLKSKASWSSKKTKNQVDLRPGFMRTGKLYSLNMTKGSPSIEEASSGDASRFSKDLLATESKVFQTFDLLASKVNSRLDYPRLLVENGVEGYATLEIFFNSQGRIDEGKSSCLGSHRSLRGLLIRAVRGALVDWYSSDAVRLSPEQFRDQHFRANFEITFSQPAASQVDRIAPGTYSFLRRQSANSCLTAVPGSGAMLNLSCVAIKAGGYIKNAMDGNRKIHYEALNDRLEYFDDLGLKGMNDLIERPS